MEKTRIKKVLVFLLKLLVSAGMLWYVFSRIELTAITRIILRSEGWWLGLAWLLFVASKVVSAFRLNRFFSATGLVLPAKLNLRLYLLGMFYNLFLPGGIGGDAYKIILLNRNSEVKLKYIFQATLLDRVTGLVALIVITAILLIFMPFPGLYVWLMILAVGLIILAFHLVIKRFFPIFLRSYGSTMVQSFVVQLLQLGCAWCILVALGYRADPLVLLALFMVSSVMAVLPFTFGGAGAREFTFALATTFMQMEPVLRDTSIALGLMFYLITAATSLAGIWYLFFPKKVSFS
ncbi:MAG TPA: lysylphosphatidylglycerol synthase transmembrane domain-containing protein [Bacteroidales bacterium]|nr:lysylphosphatidylglycerol synthase transmembrane domain-containing protein [Bacteroidales bacterium]HRZ49113.1 lysylphosphatidylglycerol synthase transmembrane domain-containing protein [Bacteroidales bacterium]